MSKGWPDFDSIYSPAHDAERRVIECERREIDRLRRDRDWWRAYAQALHRQARAAGLIPCRFPDA